MLKQCRPRSPLRSLFLVFWCWPLLGTFGSGSNQSIQPGAPKTPQWLPKLNGGTISLPTTATVDLQAGILRRFGAGERNFNAGVSSIALAPDGRIWGVAVSDLDASWTGKHANVLFSVGADGANWLSHADVVATAGWVSSAVTVTREGLTFVVMGTTQPMLFRYDPSTGELTNLRQLGGLSKPLWSDLVQLADATLCVTTADGFYRLQPDGTAPVFHSLAASGLANFNRGVLQGENGWLYILGQTGGDTGCGGIARCRPDGSDCTLWSRLSGDLCRRNPSESRSALMLGSDGLLYGTAGHFFYNLLYRVYGDGSPEIVAVPPNSFECWGPRVEQCGANGPLDALFGRPVEHGGYIYGSVGGGPHQQGSSVGVFRVPLPTTPATTVQAEVLGLNSDIPQSAGAGRWLKNDDGLLLSPSRSGIISFRPGLSGVRRIRGLGATGADADRVAGPLIRDGKGNLFGVSWLGGILNSGTVFLAREDGSTNAILHSFTGGEGDVLSPSGFLVRGADGWLYGTSELGGHDDFTPKLYRLHPGTGAFEIVATLPGTYQGTARPRCGLMVAGDGQLFGTTPRGGAADLGTLFRFDPERARLTVLHEFGATLGDRWQPRPELLIGRDGFLYGLTEGTGDGQHDSDGLFRISIAGAGYRTLARLTRRNSDLRLVGGLVEALDGNLYVLRGRPPIFNSTNVVTCEMLRLRRSSIPTGSAEAEVVFSNMTTDEPGIVPVGGLTVARDGWLVGLSSSDATAFFRWNPVSGEMRRMARSGAGVLAGLYVDGNTVTPPLELEDGSWLSAGRGSLWRMRPELLPPPVALSEASVELAYGRDATRAFTPLFTNSCSLAKIAGAEAFLRSGFSRVDASGISGSPTAAGTFRLEIVVDDCLLPARTATNWVNVVVTPGQLRLNGKYQVHAVGSTNWLSTGTVIGLQNNDRITVDWITEASAASPAGTYLVSPVISDPENRLANYLVTTNFGSIKLVDPKVRPSVDNSGLVLNFPGIPGKKITVEQTDRLDKPVWVKTHGFTILSETPPTVTIPPDDAHPTRFVRVTME